MNKMLIPLLLTLTVLSGCGVPTAQQPPLSGASMGGAFTLTNQDGARVSDRDFAGKYRLIYFGYTYCPDVCPVDVQRLMQGYQLLLASDKATAARLVPIFITIDPARDTPGKLKEFVNAFDPNLVGLTGSESEIADVAKRYATSFQKAPGAAKEAYLMDHSRTAVLYGPDGQPIALIPHDGTPQAIADELKRWIK